MLARISIIGPKRRNKSVELVSIPEHRIKKAWAKRFPDIAAKLFDVVKKARGRKFPDHVCVLYPFQTGLPHRLSLQPTGKENLLDRVFVHFEKQRRAGEDKVCYACVELDQECVRERVELRVPYEMREGYSPARNAIKESHQLVKLKTDKVVTTLFQIAFMSKGQEFLSQIKPKMDLRIDEADRLNLNPLQQLQLFAGVVSVLDDIHTESKLLIDVDGGNFMFDANTLKVWLTDGGTLCKMDEVEQLYYDLVPLGQNILPKLGTMAALNSQLAFQTFRWIEHRLKPEMAQTDPITTRQLLYSVQMIYSLERGAECRLLWKALDPRNQLELLGLWKLKNAQVPEFAGDNRDVEPLMQARLELLLGDQRPTAPNVLGLVSHCFLKRERRALKAWIAETEGVKSLAGQR